MNRNSEIVNGKRAITADTALRLGRYFGTAAQYWLNLQVSYDLRVAEQISGARVEREVLPLNATCSHSHGRSGWTKRFFGGAGSSSLANSERSLS